MTSLLRRACGRPVMVYGEVNTFEGEPSVFLLQSQVDNVQLVKAPLRPKKRNCTSGQQDDPTLNPFLT
jgi:hypothetical protein